MALLRQSRTLGLVALRHRCLQSCRWNNTVYRPVPPLECATVEEWSFTDSQTAFKSKSSKELLRASMVFSLCGVEAFVNHNDKILSLSRALLGRRLFKWLMKRTFYGQFAAGESREEVEPLVLRNQKFGVRSILQYSVESSISADKLPPELLGNLHHHALPEEMKEMTFDRNTASFITSLDLVADTAEVGQGMAAIKLTALGCADMLEQLTRVLKAVFHLLEPLSTDSDRSFGSVQPEVIGQALRRAGLNFDAEKLKTTWFSALKCSELKDVGLWEVRGALALSEMINAVCKDKNGDQPVPTLTPEESNRLELLTQRMHKVLERAAALQVRVLVDAEQTYLQLAIRRLALDMMKKFNRGRQVVNSTYQCYLKETFDAVCDDLNEANSEGFCFGAKLVRGAYMNEERARAAVMGYEDPVNPDFDATSAMYHRVVEEVMRRLPLVPKGAINIMVASHNEATVRFVVERMKSHNIQPTDGAICFGQLLGMSDQITFLLGERGYCVYKCLHYGPVEELLAFLGRRAQENGGFLGKGIKERQLLATEIKRRVGVSMGLA